MTKSIQRREFIRRAAFGAAGFAILPSLISKGAPSDRLRIAHIGLGGMGNQHMNWFAALPDVEIVALCDVDAGHLQSTLQTLKKTASRYAGKDLRRFSAHTRPQ